MEKWYVIGYRKVHFTDPQGRLVDGYNLYLSRPAESKDSVGSEVQKIFIGSSYVDYVPVLDQKVSILFNRYGKVSSVFVVED